MRRANFGVLHMVKGEGNSCYSAGVAGKHSNYESKIKYSDCNWILDT